MLIPPLDRTIRVPSANSVNPGSSGHVGIVPGQPHEDLKAPEAHVGAWNITRARILAEPRPSLTMGCGAVGTALSGVVGAALRLAPR